MNKQDREDMQSNILKNLNFIIRVKVAIDSETNKRYAIKIMRGQNYNQHQIQNFINECQLLSSCDSENIISLIDVQLDGIY